MARNISYGYQQESIFSDVPPEAKLIYTENEKGVMKRNVYHFLMNVCYGL